VAGNALVSNKENRRNTCESIAAALKVDHSDDIVENRVRESFCVL
jgi:hypothetical protein